MAAMVSMPDTASDKWRLSFYAIKQWKKFFFSPLLQLKPHVPKVNKKPIRNCSHTYSFIIELFISRIIVIESVYGLNSLVNTFILVQYCTGFSDCKLSKVNDYRTVTIVRSLYNPMLVKPSAPFQLCYNLLLKIFNPNTL